MAIPNPVNEIPTIPQKLAKLRMATSTAVIVITLMEIYNITRSKENLFRRAKTLENLN